MPSVLEAPESVQEPESEVWNSLEAVQTVSVEFPVPRRPFWRQLVASAVRLVPGTGRRSRPEQWSTVNDPRPEMLAIDRLARDFPHLYTLVVGS